MQIDRPIRSILLGRSALESRYGSRNEEPGESWSVCVRDGEFVGGTSMTGDGGITTMTWGDHD